MHATIKKCESIRKHSQPNHIVNTNYRKDQFSKLKIDHISQKPIEFNTQNLKLANKQKKKIQLSIHNPKSNLKSQKLSKFSPNIRGEMGRRKGWVVRTAVGQARTATGHARSAAGQARSARSVRFVGRGEEEMAVESEERGATVEMGKEERKKEKKLKYSE